MVDKSITIQGNAGQNIINTGDNNSQQLTIYQTTDNKELDAIFSKLLEAIETLSTTDNRVDDLEAASKLKDAVVNNEKARAEKIFGWLSQIIQSSSAGLQIFDIISKM
ncbi:hypothetical protein [Ectobacillus antri]|uniref:hypothetical protein n=1 Tax=Ectobacillus antri TaxID=2486280 RepID=UPI000F5AF977|nr:hypothetical protein [Ectobacillus antri]